MKNKIKILLMFSMTIVFIITQTACVGKTEPIEKTSYYFDTICKISIYDMKDISEKNANEAIEKAFEMCNDYESILSKTRIDSDIYKINHAKGKPVKCNPETIEVIKKGIYYGDLSEGAFDITVGKVTDLWDFHAEEPRLPKESSIKKALTCVDYKQINIKGNTVTMRNTGGEIDLGGIAKGYIADRLAECLKKRGVTSAIVSLGGNIAAIGDKNGSEFVIGVEKPYSNQSKIVGSVDVKNATVVTSGIYERFFELDGKKYHHILNVKTGYPIDSDIEGVTLVSELGRSADCDALSTTCLLMGVKKGTELIESIDGIEAMFIDKDGNITKTKGMKFNAENN